MESSLPMMHRVLILLAISAAAVAAQTPAKPAAPSGTAPKAAAASSASTAPKLPPGIPVVHGIVKPLLTLRYEEIKIGTGALAEPGKLYKVKYTGYRAADGVKFDSSEDHRRPVLDKDGKPENGPDGKPVLGEAEPMSFPQGMGRLIPGFDQGFAGMKIGGKRRLFIPWQLAYGTRDIPERGTDHPGIPAKSDLIFDVELVEVTDLPAMPARPGMPGRPMPPGAMRPGAPGAAPVPGAAPAAAGAPGATAAPSAAPATGAPPVSAPAPSQPPPTAQPQAATPPPEPAKPQPSTPPQP